LRFFIPHDRDERQKTFEKIFAVAADACDCQALAFLQFMICLNDADVYWRR
jgi:hypothetical protein